MDTDLDVALLGKLIRVKIAYHLLPTFLACIGCVVELSDFYNRIIRFAHFYFKFDGLARSRIVVESDLRVLCIFQ